MWNMVKKVIQVPVDDDLLQGLTELSERVQQSRSEVIRTACRRYIENQRRDHLDRIYEDGYRRLPESTEIAESQEAMIADVLPDESW